MTKSTMFVRILKGAEVNQILKMLNDEFGAEATDDGTLRQVKAPDGDVVFAAMRKQEGQDLFICRFHKEVFSEEVQ